MISQSNLKTVHCFWIFYLCRQFIWFVWPNCIFIEIVRKLDDLLLNRKFTYNLYYFTQFRNSPIFTIDNIKRIEAWFSQWIQVTSSPSWIPRAGVEEDRGPASHSQVGQPIGYCPFKGARAWYIWPDFFLHFQCSMLYMVRYIEDKIS